jgi:serine/threonine protein phosphatase 1
MRTLAVGDIHGCLEAFDLLLEQIEPAMDDVLVTLGDYVDRGPDSRGVLDRLVDLRTRTQLVSLHGNHDLMMLAARNSAEEFGDWVRSGNNGTPRSYGATGNDWTSFVATVPTAHWQFFDTCVRHYETATHIFVHANVDPNLPMAEQPDDRLYWEKLEPGWWRPHCSGKTLICGHSLQRSGRPLVLDRAICIDTGAYRDGWLTCLDVDMEVYWQANQRGETRIGNLSFRPR